MKLLSYLILLRPAQWLKNLMLFFPSFLGGSILSSEILIKGITPFISFCMASSAAYILNDIVDSPVDALHHKKRHRPIPSGAADVKIAAVVAIVLVSVSFILSFRVLQPFSLLLMSYLLVSCLYSTFLKDIPIVDLFCISAGFLFRLQAGGVVFGIEISEWLFLSVFLLAIFLSTGKRVCEKKVMGAASPSHRKSLMHYPDGFLDGIMYMTGGSVLVTYTMYVISRHTLIYSVPLCAFGLMRFMLLAKSGVSGDPTESLVKDPVLFAVGASWTVMVGLVTYLR